VTATPDFADRHIGPDPDQTRRMLAAVGHPSLDALMAAALPPGLARAPRPDLPPAGTEESVTAELRALAARNRVALPMIGLGYHGTVTPPVIRRNLLEDPRWYTAYTPYQPEISQGRLEALLTFQTMVEDLTGLPVANASLLDEPSAAAEAMLLMVRASRLPAGVRPRLLVDTGCLPQTLAVLRTRAEAVGVDLVPVDLDGELDARLPGAGLVGLLAQYPAADGAVRDLRPIAAAVHAAGGLLGVAADPLALTLLKPPGELGADLALGSTQRFGVPLFGGGPHAAYLAVRAGLERQLPGRLVGVSVDSAGTPAYRLALQTREQHIRREKATSNICTAQALLANVAAAYAVYHGPDGLREIAERAHRHAAALAGGLRAAGIAVRHAEFVDTVVARVPGRAGEVVADADRRGILLRLVDPDHVGVTCDERTTAAHVAAVLAAFGAEVPAGSPEPSLPASLLRTSEYLTHPVFHSHRSETRMLRWLRRLADADLALDRTMIPLGSCTMKLNATAEMEPVSWPEFADVHPYAPAADRAGYTELADQLARWLADVTGYDAVSLQPNAGSQGELAGLLAIRAHQRARGEAGRDVCLIPSSAHGTNAASAVLAGLRVVVVACDDHGDVDVEALRAALSEHEGRVAALMITYPSTHGVYEEGVREVCDLVHAAGGQVYIDGANLNALVGHVRPGDVGGDVSHLNLHKTFCIPHGGGGPGVGPVAVKAHLAPFLPGDPRSRGPAPGEVGAIAGAGLGSAGILPVSWTYVRLMGAGGLARATAHAVLAANYVVARLRGHYDVLYTGRGGLVAHECVLDLRPLTKRTGVTVEDVAKRLIDFGFHAPTMSFPVAGTLMVEPTESEDLVEIDRFCDAMIAIREEIERVAAGEWPADDNPLRNAPHTAEAVTADEWRHPYPRELAAYPVPGLRRGKYFPPVGRIDAARGDRSLVCACPPVEAFA
jgi:glycine dehydrogenase